MRAKEELEAVVRQLAAHPAAAGVLLHALQAVEDDQVRPPVAQPPLEPFQTPPGRALVLAEEELVALAQEGIGVGLLVERPDQHVGLAGLHAGDDPLGHRRLAGAARRHQRPHPVRRGQVGDPRVELLDQRLAAVEVRRGLERMDDADLAAALRRRRLPRVGLVRRVVRQRDGDLAAQVVRSGERVADEARRAARP